MSSTSHSTPTTPLAVNVTPPVPREPSRKRWTRAEYHRLGEEGWFRDQRVELIDGEIIEMSPQSFEHSWAVDVAAEKLRELFGSGYWVRSQAPFPRDQQSEPEPDILVCQGNRADFTDHPRTGVLAVEIAKTSVSYDTTTKQSLYASMAVPDYWVLDLDSRQLLVYRQPIADELTQFGHRYESVETIAAEGHITPLEIPTAKLAVAEMLPPAKAVDTATDSL